MDDFNEGNNFDDYDDYNDDDSSILDDVSDVKDKAKDLKNEYNNYKSSKNKANYDSSLKDNGKAFRENIRTTSNSRSAINPVTESTINTSATTGASNAGINAATGSEMGAATGSAATGGTAVGGAAAEGAAAGSTAAGGAAAGGAAAGGAAAGGAAAGGAAAAGVSATGVGAIVVAAIGLLAALKKLGDKINKKIEENTGIDTKKMSKVLLLGSIFFIFLIFFIASALFTTSATAYDDLSQLIKRREERYGKSLIMFTDEEYNETMNKDYDGDYSYETILKSYDDDLGSSFLAGLDTKDIYDDETLSHKEREVKLLKLGSGEVKKYLKAERENFNKIIWNASSGYNKYSFKSSQTYNNIGSYNSDNSGNPQLTDNVATISGSASYSDPDTYYWDIYKKYNSGLSMYEINDSNGKKTGLKIPDIIVEGESNKDEAGEYYVKLLGDYLQKWVIPYIMMIDSQDKDFIDRVMNEMYHRVDVNVYKLSQEVKNTKKSYYMKAIKTVYYNEYYIYDDDPNAHHWTDSSGLKKLEESNTNTNDNQLGTTTQSQYIEKITKDGRTASKYKETSTYITLDPSNSIATNSDGSPMVKEIKVTRNISQYKNVPKIVNIESFYDIVREQYKVTPISENNPANVTSAVTKNIDSDNGILTEDYDETWYEELEQVGQTEKKNYSVSYYTDEQVENLGRKISRVEWVQDYGNPSASSTDSSIITTPGEKGGNSGTITSHGKTYKLYNQGNFGGNIPGAGCGLTSTCMILSAYRPDLDLNPNGLASQLNWTGPHSLSQSADDMKKYGLNVESNVWPDYGGMPDKKNKSYNDIKANLQAGRPVFILVKAPCPYTIDAHYMVLIDIDNDLNVTIADPNGGDLKKDTLTNMVSYIFDNAHFENGYILIKDNNPLKSNGTSSGSTKKTDGSVSDENSKRLTEMLKYAVSLEGKVAYVWGGGPHNTKDDLVSLGADCSGFAISLYRIFFSKNFNPTRTEIYRDCELVNVDGLEGKKVFDGGSGTAWNKEIETKIKPGDIVATQGHITIYAGDIKGDGKLYTISQGGGFGPKVLEAISYYTSYPIKGICRFVGDASIISGSISNSSIDNSRIYPVKTSKELKDALNKYGNGKGYSYDDLYFAYYHIEQYYTELTEVNGHSTNSSSSGPGLGWPIDIKKYPGCEIINCFYGYTPAYGSNHSGIDISSGGHVTGTSLHVGPDIIAAHDGKVIVATGNPSSDAAEYTYVQIESEDGTIQTQYGHLSKILVKQGDTVKKGDVIGKMGNTGHSTGTHLHFAVFANGTRVDPLNYYIISKEGKDEEVDYSRIDKNSITNLPTGYKFLREKGGGSQELVDFICGWEGSTPLSADGTKYQISLGPEGNRTVGKGIDLDAGGYDAVFKKAGYSTSLGSYVDKDFVDALMVKEISKTFRDPIISRVSGLNLKDYQIDALVSRAYNCGVEGALWERNGKNFINAYKAYWKNGDESRKVNYNHPLYTNYMSEPITSDGVVMPGLIKRRQSEWKLFQTGVYDSSH